MSLLNDIRSIFSPTFAYPLIKYPSPQDILHHTNDMVEPAQPLNINTLHNIYVVEELIQLTIKSDAEFIAIINLFLPTDARSFPSPTASDSSIKYPSPRSILFHTYDMTEPAQPLHINTLHNVHVVEEPSYSLRLNRMH